MEINLYKYDLNKCLCCDGFQEYYKLDEVLFNKFLLKWIETRIFKSFKQYVILKNNLINKHGAIEEKKYLFK